MANDTTRWVEEIRDALARGELKREELSTRRLATRFGKSTMLVYHHFGSLEGLLHAVSQSGMALLCGYLDRAGDAVEDVAEAFVAFGLEAPALYSLMFEHPFDWEALRKAGALHDDLPGLHLFRVLVAELAEAGAKQPLVDARLLFAGVHGLVSLALSGRANIGERQVSDEAVAKDAARELARRLGPEKRRKKDGHHSHDAAAAQRSLFEEPSRQVSHERKAGRPRRRSS
jgi:AcrR family transcriptional regulator